MWAKVGINPIRVARALRGARPYPLTCFIATSTNFAVMPTAYYWKLESRRSPFGLVLGFVQIKGDADLPGLASADQTGTSCNELETLWIADPTRLEESAGLIFRSSRRRSVAMELGSTSIDVRDCEWLQKEMAVVLHSSGPSSSSANFALRTFTSGKTKNLAAG